MAPLLFISQIYLGSHLLVEKNSLIFSLNRKIKKELPKKLPIGFCVSVAIADHPPTQNTVK